MAGFVDCNKYKHDQEAVSTALGNLADADKKLSENVDELNKRGINHDDTLTGDGLPDGVKLGVKKSDKSGNAVDTSDGVYVKDLEPRLKKVEDSRPTADDRLLDKSGSNGENGRITVEKIKEAIAGDVKVNVNPSTAITGNGSAASPLSLNISEDFEERNGRLYLKSNEPSIIDDLTDLSKPLRRLGFTTFSGVINNVSGSSYVKGVVPDFMSEDSNQNGTSLIGELASNQNYDFNGWQLASSREVQQFISNNGVTWERSNDSGMRPDGSLVDPNQWTAWKRSTNISIEAKQFANLLVQAKNFETQIRDLERDKNSLSARLDALEGPCKVGITEVASHTVSDSDNVIVSTGGTVTFPQNLTIGRTFTVINKGSNDVVLSGTMSPPNTKVASEGAVTVIVTGVGENRVFGAMEE